jgi:hypothetical protein
MCRGIVPNRLCSDHGDQQAAPAPCCSEDWRSACRFGAKRHPPQHWNQVAAIQTSCCYGRRRKALSDFRAHIAHMVKTRAVFGKLNPSAEKNCRAFSASKEWSVKAYRKLLKRNECAD